MKKSTRTKADLRHLAEVKLSERKEKHLPLTKVDALRLIHDLEVHQIELEIQNEELAQAQAEAERIYGQYTDLYDFAPVGYFTLGSDGTIRQVNLAGANLLGVERVSLLNRQLGLFVSEKSHPALNVFLERLSSGRGKKRCELLFEKKENEVLWASIEATCFEGGQESRAVMTDITERKQMLQALEESENRFRTILQDVSTIAVQGYASDGTTQYWNSASERLYGYSAQEAIGKNLLDLIIPPEMQNEIRQAIQQMTETGEPIPAAELSLMRKDGSRVPVYSSHAIVTGAGHAPELFCLDVDLTERKQAEEALRESEYRNRIISELTTDYIFVVDVTPDGSPKLRWASDNMFRVTGRKPAEVETLDSWSKVIHPDDKSQFFDFINQILFMTEGREHELECRTFNKQVGERWVRILARTQVNEKNVVTTIIGAIQDITGRKQSEQVLRQSEERFRLLFDKAPLGYQSLDGDGKFLDVNQAWLDMLGYSRAEVLNHWFGEFLAPEYMEAFQKRFPIFKASGQTHSEFEMLHKDGSRHWISFEGRVGYELDWRFKQAHCILQDITESRKAEEALRESQELFSLFMVHSPIYAFIKEVTPTESRVLQASENYQQMIGVSGRDLIGKTMDQLYPAEFAARITADDWSVITNNAVLKVDETLNGRHYTSIKFPIYQGGKTLLAGYTIDITERVQAEIALKNSELFIKGVLNSLTAHIAVLDEQATIIAVNEAWREFARKNGSNDSTGYVGANYLAVCQSAIESNDMIAQQVEQGLRAVMDRSQSQFSVEYPCDAPSQPRWYTVTVLPMPQSHHGLVVIHEDITERKRAELELQYMKSGLESANSELKAALIREQQLAHTDVLTGINNRRHLYELAEHEFEIAMRYRQPLSVMMFDIDHFKQVNDTFGHMAGDQMLQVVTQVASEELRSADVIGRYGGEEFVIILPMTNAQQAYPVAERIRERVAEIRVPTEKGNASVTLSIGIIEFSPSVHTESIDDLIRRADETMYAAKQAGRNRTEIGK
jgi:diguanylate cyclase (GGDEF)-like protein/PAS domain S-box-containing protein